MKIELMIEMSLQNGEAISKTFEEETLSALPIPIPAIGDHIDFASDGQFYSGVVTKRLFDLTDDDDDEVFIQVFADEVAKATDGISI